jgi:hypothetical protein
MVGVSCKEAELRIRPSSDLLLQRTILSFDATWIVGISIMYQVMPPHVTMVVSFLAA